MHQPGPRVPRGLHHGNGAAKRGIFRRRGGVIIGEVVHHFFNPHGLGWGQHAGHQRRPYNRIAGGIYVNGKRRNGILSCDLDRVLFSIGEAFRIFGGKCSTAKIRFRLRDGRHKTVTCGGWGFGVPHGHIGSIRLHRGHRCCDGRLRFRHGPRCVWCGNFCFAAGNGAVLWRQGGCWQGFFDGRFCNFWLGHRIAGSAVSPGKGDGQGCEVWLI